MCVSISSIGQESELWGRLPSTEEWERSQQPLVDKSNKFNSPTLLDPSENVEASYHRKDGSGEGDVVSAVYGIS